MEPVLVRAEVIQNTDRVAGSVTRFGNGVALASRDAVQEMAAPGKDLAHDRRAVGRLGEIEQ